MQLFALWVREVVPTTGKMSDVSALFTLHHFGLFDPWAAKKLYFAAICGMNGGNRCPYPPFPFPPITPDTGTGSSYLHRTCDSSCVQPLLKQGSQCLTLFHIGEAYLHS